MRWHLSVLLALVATGCGTKTYHVDPQIQPYIDRFVKTSNEVGAPVVVDNLVASIGTTAKTDYAGQCVIGNGTPTMTLNSIYWPTFDDALREELVFHELGHCVLNRLHNNDVDARGIPVSIMYGQMQVEGIYSDHRADWFVEMFWYKGGEEQNLDPGTVIN